MEIMNNLMYFREVRGRSCCDRAARSRDRRLLTPTVEGGFMQRTTLRLRLLEVSHDRCGGNRDGYLGMLMPSSISNSLQR